MIDNFIGLLRSFPFGPLALRFYSGQATLPSTRVARSGQAGQAFFAQGFGLFKVNSVEGYKISVAEWLQSAQPGGWKNGSSRMVANASSIERPANTSHHLPVCRMYARLKRPFAMYASRVKLSSKNGDIALGPGHANLARKYRQFLCHFV